jgi:hypothetical protein
MQSLPEQMLRFISQEYSASKRHRMEMLSLSAVQQQSEKLMEKIGHSLLDFTVYLNEKT